MKNALGKIVVILVCLGLLYFVYAFALPEYPQSMVKGFIQPKINATAKTRIEEVQQAKCKEVDNLSYGQIFANVDGGCWIYETPEKSSDGAEHVIFYGRGVSVNLKDWQDYNEGLMYTSTSIKMDFIIRGNSFELVPYIDDFQNPLKLYDGKHERDNDKVREDILDQIYNGMRKDQ